MKRELVEATQKQNRLKKNSLSTFWSALSREKSIIDDYFAKDLNCLAMTSIKKQVPITGTGDFLKLLESEIFVDKTLFIKDFLQDGAEALLITRPRRWGKTLNMSMLYHFLRCEVQQDPTTGKLQTINPNPGIFEQLRIGQEYPELVANNQGQWPVISFTLKGVVGDTITSLERGFKGVLARLYNEHSYLRNWLKSQKHDEEALENLAYFSQVTSRQASWDDLQESLLFLCKLLHDYHGSKVFVLLDEYDSPLNNTALRPELYQAVLTFFRGFFGNCFKDNIYLNKGILTGILRLAKADLFSGLNNFSEYSVLHREYAEHFGFTKQEVNDLFKNPLVEQLIPKPQLRKIKRWYNGYLIGRFTIYNPWSIMCCIKAEGTIEAYWVGSGSDTLLRDLLRDNDILLQGVEELIAQHSLYVVVSSHIDLLNMSPEIKFWSIMLSAGYITLAKKPPQGSSTKIRCQVKIPNQEIRDTHEELIVEWFKARLGVSYASTLSIALLEEEIATFTEELNKYLAIAASVRNVGLRKAELFYSGFMVGLFMMLRQEFTISTELESGKGYVDMVAIPKEDIRPIAIVFEYKLATKQEELETKAQEALDQIEQKQYLSKIKHYKYIQQVAKVGIAFYGKEALVKRAIIDIAQK